MSTLGRFIVIVTLLLSFTAVAPGQIAQPAPDAEFTEQLKRLDPGNEKETRLNALGWINAHSRDKIAVHAIPALEKCIRDDPQAEVRQRAVGTLGQLARRLERPCPLVIFEALHDKEDFVRYEAVVWAGLFKTFAPGSADVLLRGVKADNAELRSSSLLLLARVAGKNPKALEAMEEATRDKVLDVRHSARMALFIAKDKLEEHLPYLIRVREDPDSFLSPGPENSEDGKRERAYRNLVVLGSAMELARWSDARADELADVLLKLLQDKSAVQRRGAAKLVGATVVKVEFAPKRDDVPLAVGEFAPVGGPESLLPFVDPEAAAKGKKDTPVQKSNVALRLEKLGVDVALRKLRDDDPDRSVREAAGWALERLASVPAKKP
jgi:HEAT repeat protein